MNILVKHVHGGYMNGFVQGSHSYWLPVADDSGAGGRREMWPPNVRNLTPQQSRDVKIDLAVLQNANEFDEFPHWLGGRVPGREVPAVYIEHNAPQGRINEMRHPLADRNDVTVVHVTHFNALFWDTGTTRTVVVEHGVPDPGYRYTGELARCAASINEAKRRHRVVGNDLIAQFERVAPVDVFGIGTSFDLPTDELHARMAQHRLYLHPYRWTSLGLSLLEAMHLGMPVVALATTETPYAVPADAGIVSNRLDVLLQGVEWLMKDERAAREMGERARTHALAHYNLARFLADWENVFAEALNRSELPTTNKLDTPIAAAAKIG